MRYGFVICLLMLMGCSPAQRLARLQKRHPELFKQRIDTVITHHYTIDTITQYSNSIDTVVTIDTFNKIKIMKIHVFDTILKKITINKRDTITIYKQKFIPKIDNPKNPFPDWLTILIIFVLLILILKWTILK